MNCLLTRLIHRDSLRPHCWLFVGWLLMSATGVLHAQTTAPAENAPNPAPETGVPEPAPEQEPAPSVSREERYNQLLAEAKPDEVRWLETPDEKILALFRPTEARTTKGAVLILHAAEVPPGWPPSFENLRRYLPRYGWVTLAVALPSQQPSAVPEREIPPPAQEEQTDQQEAADEATPAEEKPAAEPPAPKPQPSRTEIIARRVGAAAAFLREQGQENILVLVDNSSVVDSMAALQPSASNPPQALILVNLQTQEPLTREQLEGLFANPALPVLDLFTQANDDQQAALRQRHRAAALRNKMENYYPLQLLPLQPQDLDNPRSFWLERTRGFMERQAQGKETKSDDKQE